LLAMFSKENTTVHVHPGGHMVPTASGKFKQTLVAFLDRF